MTSMSDSALVFVDTNVFIYALTEGSDPRHDKARRHLQPLLEAECVCLSTQVLQEVFVTLTKKLGRSTVEAITVIEDLAAYTHFQVDAGAVLDAGRLAGSARISFWDALLIVSAARLGAEILLTEDLNPGQPLGGVRIASPF